MKNIYSFTKMLVIILFTFFVALQLSATTYTSVKDGSWGIDETWGNTQGNVPGIGDDVIILHQVAIGPHWPNASKQCHNLTIGLGAKLDGWNIWPGDASLSVHGDFSNSGTLTDGASRFYLYAHGNVVNNGTISNYNLTMRNADQQQQISLGAGKTLACYQFEFAISEFPIIATTDLVFDNVYCSFYNRELQMNDGANFTFNNECYANSMVLTTSSKGTINLYMNAQAGLRTTTVDVENINLFDVTVIDGLVNFTGNIFVNDTLRSNGGRTLTVGGDVNIPEGAVVANDIDDDALKVHVAGDLILNGLMTNYELSFIGDQTQEWTLGANSEFTCIRLLAEYSDSPVILNSDLVITNAYLHFNDRIFQFNSGVDVDIDGLNGTSSVYDVVFDGELSNTLTMANNARLEGVEVHQMTMDGICRIVLADFTDVTIAPSGFVQVYGSYDRNLYTYGTFTNEGTLRDNPEGNGRLLLRIIGDMVNNGEWDAYRTYLEGTGPQSISSNGPITGENFDNENANADVTALSDLNFVNTTVDFSTHKLIMETGQTISLDGGKLQNIVLETANKGFCELTLSNNANLYVVDAEDVILNGECILSSAVSFDNLVLEGTIYNYSSQWNTLVVNGSLTNNGQIINSPDAGTFYLEIGGDIINNGIWTNKNTKLKGIADQQISCLNMNKFACEVFENENTIGNATALTDLYFENCDIDLENHVLDLSGGHSLVIDDVKLYRANLVGNALAKEQCKLISSNDSYFYNSQAANITFEGIVDNYGTSTFENITVNGTLQNRIGNTVTTYINGYFHNYGTIRNNPGGGSLTLHMSGDIINDGIWSHKTAYLTGTADQYISCLNDKVFNLETLNNDNVSGNIVADGDLNFTNCAVDMENHPLDMTAGWDLSMSGGRLYRAQVSGGDGSAFNFNDDAYLYNSHVSDMIFTGTVANYGNCELHNPTIEGILQNRNNQSVTTIVTGAMINNGQIIKSPVGGNFTVHIYGDCENNGIFNVYKIYLYGDTDQHFSCTEGMYFSCDNFYNYNTSADIIADSDLRFVNTLVDFQNNGALDLSGGWEINLTGDYLYRATIIGGNGAGLELSDGAFMYNVSASDVYLDGVVGCYGTIELQNATNHGTLQNRDAQSTTAMLSGTFTNNGQVSNSEGTGNFTASVMGDVVNNGTWDNYRTTFDGVVDQEIVLMEGQPITSDTWFVTPSSGSPYQWYHNGVLLDSENFTGETNPTLKWLVPVSNSWAGVFLRGSGGGNSRNITIKAMFDQVVSMPAGWSGISSFVDPMDSDVINIFDPISGSMMIVYNDDGMYYPAGDINTLSDWDVYSGYIIKLTGEDNLTISGFDPDNKTVNLIAGLNLLPVLSKSPVDAETLLSGVVGFVMLKDVAGTEIYWPAKNINTIGNLIPGKAYYIEMSEGGTVTFD